MTGSQNKEKYPSTGFKIVQETNQYFTEKKQTRKFVKKYFFAKNF